MRPRRLHSFVEREQEDIALMIGRVVKQPAAVARQAERGNVLRWMGNQISLDFGLRIHEPSEACLPLQLRFAPVIRHCSLTGAFFVRGALAACSVRDKTAISVMD